MRAMLVKMQSLAQITTPCLDKVGHGVHMLYITIHGAM